MVGLPSGLRLSDPSSIYHQAMPSGVIRLSQSSVTSFFWLFGLTMLKISVSCGWQVVWQQTDVLTYPLLG